ncbi:hypothetical protein DPMN_062929 [Dreissena polymorpha]|uniref:Uncharacterized protein n=1 Tax=Dreissena polymorpha TaxID=45954 RepID=A0A9D4CAB4_DREPO|nr:hypothetical protein DPMN_062929 [Dreissena polymorpha]
MSVSQDNAKLSVMERVTAQTELQALERKLQKSCIQINLLYKQLEFIKARYQKATCDRFNRFRYTLRLKLAVVEGVRNMYFEYAHAQAEHVALLRQRLYGEVLNIGTEN